MKELLADNVAYMFFFRTGQLCKHEGAGAQSSLSPWVQPSRLHTIFYLQKAIPLGFRLSIFQRFFQPQREGISHPYYPSFFTGLSQKHDCTNIWSLLTADLNRANLRSRRRELAVSI